MKTIAGEKTTLTTTSKISQGLMRVFNHFPFIPSKRCYNLTISETKKFVWFRVAKIGTRTIYEHLKESRTDLSLEHPYNVLYAPRLYKDYFKFGFVRNPWDRIVSTWHNKVVEENYFKFNDIELKRMRHFNNFVDYVLTLDIEKCNNHFRSQCALIDLNEIDYLGRYESFEDNLRYVLSRIGIKPDRLLWKNKSNRKKDYRSYYNNALKDKVYQIYQKDIDIFGYQFD